MLTVVRRVLTVAVFVCLPWLAATAGVVDCKCKNGTDCKVSCLCSGTISCGLDACSGGCAACPQSGVEAVAETTAMALYRNAFILTKGYFGEKELIAVYSRLLAAKPDGVTIRKVETPEGLYVTLTLQTDGVTYTVFLVHSLQIPEKFYSNEEVRKRMVDTVTKNAPELLKRKELNPDYLKQFLR